MALRFLELELELARLLAEGRGELADSAGKNGTAH